MYFYRYFSKYLNFQITVLFIQCYSGVNLFSAPFIQINTEVCQILGIRRSLCAPYHPQTNGLVERLNGTIQRLRDAFYNYIN